MLFVILAVFPVPVAQAARHVSIMLPPDAVLTVGGGVLLQDSGGEVQLWEVTRGQVEEHYGQVSAALGRGRKHRSA
jgi:hypothetical protein